MTKKFRFCIILILTSLLFIIISQLNITPVGSQIISLPGTLEQNQNFDTIQQGNLDVAKVRLDGKVLFSVAALSTASASKDITISPIERRVKTIEFHLSKIVKDGFDPNTLKIYLSTLNHQTIIVASDKNWGPRYILTVTHLDVELDEPGTIDNVANNWSQIIKEALFKAREQRQPEYRKQQISIVIAIFVCMVVASIGVRMLQKFRKTLRERLKKIKQEQQAIAINDNEPIAFPLTTDEDSLEYSQKHPRVGLKSYLPQLNIDQQIYLNFLLRFVLYSIQLIIWFGGMAIIFRRFPETYAWGGLLLRIPVAYISIPLGMLFLKSLVDQFLFWYLKRKADQMAEKGNDDIRLQARGLSILSVLQQLTGYVIVLIGIMWFFYIIKAFNIVLIAIGAIAFLAQNTIKEIIQTYFILFEDQYALGDWIQIGNVNGGVEKISLRVTQLRTAWGDLVSISHGSFNEVINFTHQYSGTNILMDVAYKTDLDQALDIMEKVAKKMQQDSVWGKYITKIDVKGVQAFGDNSITLRLVIKTEVGEQWGVKREYYRRIKPAFDQAGISIPFPQRSIWFENKML